MNKSANVQRANDRMVFVMTRCAILAAMAVSTVFTFAPLLRDISGGIRVIILTVAVAAVAAWAAPVKEEMP